MTSGRHTAAGRLGEAEREYRSALRAVTTAADERDKRIADLLSQIYRELQEQREPQWKRFVRRFSRFFGRPNGAA